MSNPTWKLLPKLNQLDNQVVWRKWENGREDSVILIAQESAEYSTFKSQINADEAQLEDADGNLMSPEEAKAFVATLP